MRSGLIVKIVMFFIVPMLFIALILSMNGVSKVEFGDGYYAFIQRVARKYNDWKLSIPNIPTIPKNNNVDSWRIITALIEFANAFIRVFNGLLTIINMVINALQFVLTLIMSLFLDIPRIISGDWSDYNSGDYPSWDVGWSGIHPILTS